MGIKLDKRRPQAPEQGLAAFVLCNFDLGGDLVMRNLPKTLTVIIVITGAIVWLLTARERSSFREVTIPSTPSQAVTLDRPRPEVRIERLLNLEEPNGFDPDLQKLLRRERERQEVTAAHGGFQQTASVVRLRKGGGSP